MCFVWGKEGERYPTGMGTQIQLDCSVEHFFSPFFGFPGEADVESRY